MIKLSVLVTKIIIRIYKSKNSITLIFFYSFNLKIFFSLKSFKSSKIQFFYNFFIHQFFVDTKTYFSLKLLANFAFNQFFSEIIIQKGSKYLPTIKLLSKICQMKILIFINFKAIKKIFLKQFLCF